MRWLISGLMAVGCAAPGDPPLPEPRLDVAPEAPTFVSRPALDESDRAVGEHEDPEATRHHAVVRIEKRWVDGALDAAAIAIAERPHFERLRTCYEQVLDDDETTAGSLVVAVRVGRDGTVGHASVPRANFDRPGLVDCLTSVWRQASFPAADDITDYQTRLRFRPPPFARDDTHRVELAPGVEDYDDDTPERVCARADAAAGCEGALTWLRQTNRRQFEWYARCVRDSEPGACNRANAPFTAEYLRSAGAPDTRRIATPTRGRALP